MGEEAAALTLPRRGGPCHDSSVSRGTPWYRRLVAIIGSLALFVLSQQSELGLVLDLLLIAVSLLFIPWVVRDVYLDRAWEGDGDQP